jgi:D-alanyl-D-alanine carboxypeptidase
MLIESGNDCAEVIARAYPNGGRRGFLEAMARKAGRIGAMSAKIYTPSGLDRLMVLGRKESRDLPARKPNTASARDVAVIAQHAFQYPLIREIASMKQYTMRTLNETPRNYSLVTNDKLLSRKLPVAGAKTGYTNLAGRCIVALFKDQGKEHMVVVLNTPSHFKAAEKIYRWASKTF